MPGMCRRQSPVICDFTLPGGLAPGGPARRDLSSTAASSSMLARHRDVDADVAAPGCALLLDEPSFLLLAPVVPGPGDLLPPISCGASTRMSGMTPALASSAELAGLAFDLVVRQVFPCSITRQVVATAPPQRIPTAARADRPVRRLLGQVISCHWPSPPHASPASPTGRSTASVALTRW